VTGALIGAAYDGRADEYIERFGTLGETDAHFAELIGRWRDLVEGPVLDAGCGPGQWTDFLASRRPGGAVGIDASARFVAAARERYPQLRITHGDLAELPFADDSFDGILAWYSLIHTPPADLPPILRELARVLRPGGSLLLGFFDGPARTPFDHAVTTAWFWSPDALRVVLEPEGFTVETVTTRATEGVRPHGELIARLAT